MTAKPSEAPDWPLERLGEVLHVKHGYAFKGEHFCDRGRYVVLTPGNFREEGGFKLKEPEKYYCADPPGEFVLKPGSILVAMTEQSAGLLGSPLRVPTTGVYLHNQRLGLVTPNPRRLDSRFTYYLFNHSSVRNQIVASATGAKVRHTAPRRIEDVEVRLPPIGLQRKIAAILSAYDNLIENNARRIPIMEEMARAVYQEWFVHFRFPGSEQSIRLAPDAGSIPAGWREHPLGGLAEEVREPVDPQRIAPETPYLSLGHMPKRSIALGQWGEASEVTSAKLRFRAGDLLFGKIRPYFHKVGVAPVSGVGSTDVIVIRPRRQELHAAVLGCVSSDEFVAHATQTSQGTKMPRANWDILSRYPVPVPPPDVLALYNRAVDPVVELLTILVHKNRLLRQTRDLLLPRLVSGELDVADLDIDVPAPVA